MSIGIEPEGLGAGESVVVMAGKLQSGERRRHKHNKDIRPHPCKRAIGRAFQPAEQEYRNFVPDGCRRLKPQARLACSNKYNHE
jgi:hypothetical protein